MSAAPTHFSLADLAARLGGEVQGDGALVIRGVNGLVEARPGELSFYGSGKYKKQLEQTQASAVLVPRGGALPKLASSLVRVDNPHLAYAKALALFFPRPAPAPGVHPRAVVHPNAEVHPTATVMANATVEAGAKVGQRAVLYPGVYVGERAQVGDDCVLHANVTVYERCVLGARVVLHAGAVVGSDGFGYAFDPSKPEHFKVPQVGVVRIEDDVEIGANSCIDRATVGETVIGRGSKIDNLVQLAHNVKVGPMSILCAQAGVAGSSTLGTGVVLAGQVGVVGHLHLGDGVMVGSQSGVSHDVEAGQTVSGSPAIAHNQWRRATVVFAQLAELAKDVARIKRALGSKLEESK